MNWLDRKEYPFKSNYIEVDSCRMHYVDEGKGKVVLMVHGTPEWSFGYRHLIKGLSMQYRCIAPDLIGMGLSDKPQLADYSVKAHAERLEKFITRLGLKNINIIANDFGGSIAMHYAIKYPDNVDKICLFNTWMWSLRNDKHYSRPAMIMGSWIGRLLYKKFNFSVNVLMPQAYGNKSLLTKQIHEHYKQVLPIPEERNATYAFAKQIMDAGEWWDSLWQQMDKVKTKPFLFFWGMKDSLIPPKELARWQNALPSSKVVKLDQAGHFVQEEEPEKMVDELRRFLG